jgi:hypothetical protein
MTGEQDWGREMEAAAAAAAAAAAEWWGPTHLLLAVPGPWSHLAVQVSVFLTLNNNCTYGTVITTACIAAAAAAAAAGARRIGQQQSEHVSHNLNEVASIIH